MSMTEDAAARPPRPHLPLLLVSGVILWVVAALLWPALRIASGKIVYVAGALSLGAAIGTGLWSLREARGKGASLAQLAALSALAAVALCCFWAGALHGAMDLAPSPGGGIESARWRAELAEDARRGDFGWQAEAILRDGSGTVLKARLNLPDSETSSLLQGEAIEVSGTLRPPAGKASEYYWNAGLAASLTVDEASLADGGTANGPFVSLRRRALDLLAEHGGCEAPLLQALVCGWRPAIEESGLYEQFKTVGLAHLVAVSGAHLSIVTLFVAGGLRMLRLGRKATTIASSLFLIGYVAFTGMPVSALRAAVMAATGLFSLWADRRSSALGALGLCLLVFVGLDPTCALSASFVLSAGSTLGIVLFAPLLSSAFEGRRLKSAVGDPLALTGSAALATQPYAAALFSQLPLLSPVSNLVAGPLFTAACLVGFVAVLVACLVPFAASWLIGAAALACAPLSAVVGALASIPGTCAPIDADPLAAAAFSFSLCLAIWVWWPRVSVGGLAAAGGAVALALLVLRLPLGMPADAIVMLDVGQGDAFLVRSGGRALLIDTGNQDALLKAALARQRVSGLDAVVISHSDDDHCGSLPVLREVAPASELLVFRDLPRCPCAACTELMSEAASVGLGDAVVLAPGDEIRCGRFRLTVLWPDAFAEEGGNGDSLCLLCAWDGDGNGEAEWTALFTGDAETDQLREVADRLPADGVDVLKVPHHGSKNGLDAALIERLTPEVALIGVGEGNRYGHPSREVLDLFADEDVSVFRSDERGDVTVAFSEDRLTVSAQKP